MKPVLVLDTGPLGLLFQRRRLKVADDCRLAAEAIEAQTPAHIGAIAGAVHALRHAFRVGA